MQYRVCGPPYFLLWLGPISPWEKMTHNETRNISESMVSYITCTYMFACLSCLWHVITRQQVQTLYVHHLVLSDVSIVLMVTQQNMKPGMYPSARHIITFRFGQILLCF